MSALTHLIVAATVALTSACNFSDPIAPDDGDGNNTVANNTTTTNNTVAETNNNSTQQTTPRDCGSATLEYGASTSVNGCTDFTFQLAEETNVLLTFSSSQPTTVILRDDDETLDTVELTAGVVAQRTLTLEPGAYLIVFGEDGLDFTGTVQVETATCPAPTALDLSGDLQSGELAAGDCIDGGYYDDFVVSFEERAAIDVTAQAAGFTPVVQIISPTGEVLAEGEGGAVSNFDSFDEVIVRISGGDGAYEYRAERIASDCEIDDVLDADTLYSAGLSNLDCQTNQVIPGFDAPEGRADLYTLEVTTDGYYRIDAYSPARGIDLRVLVFGPDGVQIANNGEVRGANPAIVERLAPSTYVVVITTNSSTQGTYDLVATRAASPLCPDNVRIMRIDPPGAVSGSLWACENGIYDVPIFVTTAQDLSVSTTGSVRVELLRSQGDEAVAFANCDAAPSCRLNAAIEPGITWLRFSGDAADVTFDATIN